MRFRKSDIERHTDNGYGTYYPAVNVKVHGRLGLSTEEVMEKFGCTEEVAEKAIQFAFDSECESFWEYWQDTSGCFENGLYGSPEYDYFPGYKVRVDCQGRSGGWLVVQGLPPVEDWDAVMVARWNKFQKAVKEDVAYKTSKEPLMEGIEANNWALPHAEQYNFFEKSDGSSVCIAEVKADVIAYAQEKHGFVPALP